MDPLWFSRFSWLSLSLSVSLSLHRLDEQVLPHPNPVLLHPNPLPLAGGLEPWTRLPAASSPAALATHARYWSSPPTSRARPRGPSLALCPRYCPLELGDERHPPGSLVNTMEVFNSVHKSQFMNTQLAMSGVYDEKPPTEVSTDPACSRNSIDEDDDWVIVKKQRITILIPPPSPDAANPESDRPTVSSKHSSLSLRNRDWDAARKKHPKQLIAVKSKNTPEDGNSEKAQVDHSEGTVQKDVPKMVVDIPLHSHTAPVIKSEWTEGGFQAVKGLFHQGSGQVANSTGIMYNPRMPVISSPVADKIMRARLLERRVARFGGLRNWLFDCGLGWFVGILDSEKLGMYQLVSLTMTQLKDMGLVAVGPRRKLVRAIDSLCRPRHVETVS